MVLELSNLVVGTIDVDAASLSSLDGFALPLLVIGTALSPSSDWQPAAPERWCGSLVSVSRKARAESTCCLSALGCAVRSGMVHLCVNAYMHEQAVVCTRMKLGENGFSSFFLFFFWGGDGLVPHLDGPIECLHACTCMHAHDAAWHLLEDSSASFLTVEKSFDILPTVIL